MDFIRITDDPSEMAAIGAGIFRQKTATYKPSTCNIIRTHIDKVMTQATEEEKQQMFYRSIYDYWVYGNNIGEEFFYGFDRKTHEEKCRYVTFQNRFRYIHHLNNRADKYLLDNKYVAYENMKPYYRREIILLEGEEDYGRFLDFTQRHPVFIVKPLDLGLTQGVHREDMADWPDPRALFDQLLEEGRTYTQTYTWGRHHSMILEELIPQCAELSAVHPTSVNAVRCTTVRVDGKVHIFTPWLKIGMGGEFITGGPRGSLLAPIDVDTGVICGPGYDEFTHSYEIHPYTGVPIRGMVIPRWEEMKQMAVELALMHPTLGYIGWDLALTDEGWCVMEGNFAGEFLGQLVHRRGMKQEVEALLGWKPDKQFWWEK